MKTRYVLLLIGLVVLLAGSTVACSPRPPTSVSGPATEEETEVEVEPEAEPSLPTIPLNVRIDYIAVKNAHGGNVQLVVVASDGDTIEKHLIPPVEEGFPMSNFEVKRIKQRVFHTSSVKDKLKINILAYHRDQSKTDYLAAIGMMEWYYGDSINMLKQLIENMPENDELIGYYEETWGLDESWGVGQHNEVGHGDDFRVWFSIYSDKDPPLVAEPPFLPNVKIKVNVPPQISKRPGSEFIIFTTYPITATLINNEAIDVEVDWEASCVIGMFYYGGLSSSSLSGKALVPASGSKLEAQYYSKATGVDQITCKISYRGKELDSSSGSVNVIP